MPTKRVLIIDDDPFIREVAQTCLEVTAGWEVLTAPGGPEGLALAATEQLDAIVLDVMMPGMDGPTVFARLQADEATRGIPVVFLTAKAGADERARLTAAGAAGALEKPFDPRTLAQRVAAFVGWPA
ncbi:MAG: response regulator with CheY-like receiver, AAA-type ATPase, and DNA-binding domain [Cyanobacteria bacterium RYN_339]|nr:response regulator with CheY-like receiver, AAA-type ATPase, and DNA-binding domain [Cyanobacteria bacterium RYN_339]